jgi:transposase
MQTITTIGLDIAKSVFQVHGVDAAGQVVIRRYQEFDRDLIRGGHYGQRPCEPHLKAEHMAAPTKPAT